MMKQWALIGVLVLGLVPASVVAQSGTAVVYRGDAYTPLRWTGIAIHPNPVARYTTWQGNYQLDDRPGQSFTGRGGLIHHMRIDVRQRIVSTNGSLRVRIYRHAGTYGSTSRPINAAAPMDTPTRGWIAQSDLLRISGVGPNAIATVAFSGANQVQLVDRTPYVFVVDWIPVNGLSTNTIAIFGDYYGSHPGNVYIDGAAPHNYGPHPWDLWFEVWEAQ